MFLRATGPAASRPLLWLLAIVAIMAWTSPGLAQSPDPLIVDLFFDLAGDNLADAGAGSSDSNAGPREILIAGIPLRLGEGAGDQGWRTMAGGNARYALPLDGPLTAVARARFARTDFVDPGAADRSFAAAATEFRYAVDGWSLALQPGVEITRWDDDVLQQDLAVEGWLAKDLGAGLRLATSAHYRWRRTLGGAAPDRRIAWARTGLTYDVPRRFRAEVGYFVQREAARADATNPRPLEIRSTGPSAIVTLPLGEIVRLSAKYDYTGTSRIAAGGGSDGDTEHLHRLNVALTWDLTELAAGARLSAAYDYGRLGRENPHRDETRHAGRVSFALAF